MLKERFTASDGDCSANRNSFSVSTRKLCVFFTAKERLARKSPDGDVSTVAEIFIPGFQMGFPLRWLKVEEIALLNRSLGRQAMS